MLPRLLCHNNNFNLVDQCDEEDISDPTDETDEQDEGDERDEVGDTGWADKKTLQGVIDLFCHIIVSASEVLNIAVDTFNSYTNVYYDKEPYHTSVLQGIGWVNELLNGHPGCI
ncbi:hypothetical protein BDR04DRAFT_429952 [Suillus decipiens]|nr:hypothetical protein BDR04DRAFT_429952 [Suillus decipiens]